MSKDRKMQVNEMIEMVKSKQTISQVRNVKQGKAIRNQWQTQVICYEVRATALRPCLHHREGFSLNPQRAFPHRNLYTQGDYNWFTQDRSIKLQ